MAVVTIYLHRTQAHLALTLHPSVSHFFRVWLWLTTGMITAEWVAIHRKHHAKVETVDDPHSPIAQMEKLNIKSPLFRFLYMCVWVFGLLGVYFYVRESRKAETINDPNYSRGVPNDWIERNIYSRHPKLGTMVMALVDILLFGPIAGIAIWTVQMIWTPIFAAGVINGVGHMFGYRNFEIADRSTNIVPWGIVIAGEELHNNHHTYPASAKLSVRKGEFDIGWMYIRILEMCGLAKVKKKIPVPQFGLERSPDLALVETMVLHRGALMREYQKVMHREWKNELAELKKAKHKEATAFIVDLKRARKLICNGRVQLSPEESSELHALYLRHPPLASLAAMRSDLQVIWTDRAATCDDALARLTLWCKNAEASRICELKKFSQHFVRRLRSP
jgi:stearoyl-CoA desaturase (delta-9 desaturase)